MSPQRKFRLARTGVILVVLIILIAKCAGSDPPAKSAGSNTPRTTTPTKPATALTVTAALLPDKLPAAHYGTAAVTVGGKVIMPGGLDAKRVSSLVVWQFDPTSSKTVNIGKLPSAAHDGAVAAIGDTVWLLGGGKGSTALTTTVSIDTAGKTANAGKLPAARVDAAAATAADGASIYVVGGYDGKDNVTGTNEVLQTTDGVTFKVVATLAQSVRRPAVVLLEHSIYVIGGLWGANGAPISSIQRVDLDTGKASVAGQLPQAISGASAVVLKGSIFVAGGRTTDGRSDQILRIDPVSAATSVAGRLPAKSSDAMSAVVGDTAYLLGGLTPDVTDSIVTLTVNK